MEEMYHAAVGFEATIALPAFVAQRAVGEFMLEVFSDLSDKI